MLRGSRPTRRTRSYLRRVVATFIIWALGRFGRPASIPWPPDSLAYDATLDQTYTYDPVHAQQLLAGAGWDSTTVLPISVPNGVDVALQMAEIIQADFTNLGVQVGRFRVWVNPSSSPAS